MDKSDSREQEGIVQEGHGIQDSEIVPEHRQSSQQLQQSEGSVQNESSELCATNETRELVHRDHADTENNIAKRDSMEIAEASDSSSPNCRKLELCERCEREYVARAHAAQQGSLFAEEQLEPERNTTLQQGAESCEKSLVARTRDSIQASEKDSNYGEQKCDRNVHPEASRLPHQGNGILKKLLILNSKLDDSCKVSEEKGQIVTHQTNLDQGSSSSIRTQNGAEKVETSVREQQLLKMMSDFFKQQQMEIPSQENKNSSASLNETEPRKSGDETISGESTDEHNVCLRNPEKNTIDRQDSVSRLRNQKVDSCELRFNSRDETVLTPKTKDYVTALPRESDATTNLQNPKDLETSIPHTSNDHKSPASQWKDYVTEHSSDQKGNVRMPPRPLREMTTRVSKKGKLIPGLERIQTIPTRVSWPLTHSDEKDRQLEEERRKILFPDRYGTSSNQTDDSLLLLPSENTVETGVRRHGRISASLLHPLQTGIRGYIQRIREHHLSTGSCFCETLKSGCIILLCSAIIGSLIVAVVYFIIVFSM